jgi:hypothetical protein
MPAKARSETVRLGEVAVYHCWNRCVRRAFLCGDDKDSGNDFGHRRDWVVSMQQSLAGLFGIEIAFRAEMGNHLHLILRTRPDIVEDWTDEDVVRRWMIICRLAKSREGTAESPDDDDIKMVTKDSERVMKIRENLSNPSWFMGTLCEYISRRSNREDDCTGRFWEDRFSCRDLVDEASILVCGIYVDLNPIRSGEFELPEHATHTSAADRISDRQQGLAQSTKRGSESRSGWMCKLTLDERERVDSPSQRTSASGRRASDKGILPITLDDYLQLLDVSGRMVRSGKASIPEHASAILDRLGIVRQHWLELITDFESLFGSIVGRPQALLDRAQRAGRHWLQGMKNSERCFE